MFFFCLDMFFFLSWLQKIQFKVLTARTRDQLKNAKNLRRRESAKIKRYGKSVWRHAKNAHQVRLNNFQLLQLKRLGGPRYLLKFRVFKNIVSIVLDVKSLNRYKANSFKFEIIQGLKLFLKSFLLLLRLTGTQQ